MLAAEDAEESAEEDGGVDSDGDAAMAAPSPPPRADTRLMYYRIVMSLFISCDQPVHALAFARCAIDATAGRPAAASGSFVTDKLWFEVFKNALTLGQKNDAFNALVQIEDDDTRQDCQSRFILELLDKRSYAWIVDFAFAHWAPHFNARRVAMISRRCVLHFFCLFILLFALFFVCSFFCLLIYSFACLRVAMISRSFDLAVETTLEQQVRTLRVQRTQRRGRVVASDLLHASDAARSP